jgi:hypothetical protein
LSILSLGETAIFIGDNYPTGSIEHYPSAAETQFEYIYGDFANPINEPIGRLDILLSNYWLTSQFGVTIEASQMNT